MFGVRHGALWSYVHEIDAVCRILRFRQSLYFDAGH